MEIAKEMAAWGFNPISVSAWDFSFSKETQRESFSVSRAQFQRGGKFQRGNAFSMLILEYQRGSGKHERF